MNSGIDSEMDFNIITRVESHAVDLSKLGLPAIKEESDKEVQEQLEDVDDVERQTLSGERVSGIRASEQKKFKFDGTSKSRKLMKSSKKVQFDKKSTQKHELVPYERHYEDLWGAITRNIGKGFMLGYGGKVSVNVLFQLLNFIRGRKVNLDRRVVLQTARDYGVFFGLLLGINNGIMYQTRERWGKYGDKSKLNRYRGYLAGFLAGISLLWVPKESRKPIIIFAHVRALELQYRMAARRGYVPCFEDADTLLMSLASASMIHSWLFSPSSLDPSYVKFLSIQVPVPLPIVDALARMQAGLPIDIVALNKIRAEMKVPLLTIDPLGYDKLPPGEIVHPGQTFLRFFTVSFLSGVKKALPVYLPVFTLPVLLFYPLSLVKAPVKTLSRTLSGVLRSTVFLALYCATGVSTITLLRQFGVTYTNLGRFAHISPAIAGFMSGLATLIEKKSRRIELALYVLGKAIEGRTLQLSRAGMLPNFEGADILVFMGSLSVIMHAYVRHANMLRPSYHSVLCRFFDADNRHVFIKSNDPAEKGEHNTGTDKS